MNLIVSILPLRNKNGFGKDIWGRILPVSILPLRNKFCSPVQKDLLIML